MNEFDYVLKFLGPVELKFFTKELLSNGYTREKVVQYIKELHSKKQIKIIEGMIHWIGPRYIRIN